MEAQAPAPTATMPFGKLADGTPATAFTLTNSLGTKVVVSDFGATMVSVETADRDGKLADITLGYDSVENYDRDTNPCFGATAGRFANRIADGKFELDGVSHQLATNNDPAGIPCHLHGGTIGFNRRLWNVVGQSRSSITFEYVSPAGEEHYPGTLTARLTYRLTEENELEWEATATTDAPTPVNLVNHTYWNLSGDPTTTVHDHLLTIAADHFLPTNPGMIPTGAHQAVEGTPLDFRSAFPMGERLGEDFDALEYGNGYDSCWVISEPAPDGLAFAARAEDPKSGRILEVFTNQPGLQLYGGNYLGPEPIGRQGVEYQPGSGFCFEAQGFPDAPNQPDFPNSILRPGETYRHLTKIRFSVR